MDAIQTQRRKRLAILADFYAWEDGPDYNYEYVTARLEEGIYVERFIAISEDESYSFPHFADDLGDAEKLLEEQVGQSTGGNPVGVLDLGTWQMHPPVISLTLGDPSDYSTVIDPRKEL